MGRFTVDWPERLTVVDATDWDHRYADADLVWSKDPNVWVSRIVGPMPPGTALDVAAGEGRNALWLVERGWTVVATDFSEVAIERCRKLAEARLGPEAVRLTTLVRDATEPAPALPDTLTDKGLGSGTGIGGTGYDLAVLCYLHLPRPEWTRALRSAVSAVRPGGAVVVVAHSLRNLTEGVGGPPDPEILLDPEALVESAAGLPVEFGFAEIRRRPVVTDDGTVDALDTVALLIRR